MEARYVRCLNNSISRFIHLMSCQTSRGMPSQNDFESMANMLKQLKPVLDEIGNDKLASEANLCKECEDLDIYINAARDFVERWSPRMSKLLSVLHSEELLKIVRRSALEICSTLCRLLRTSASSSNFTGVQHCIQELESWQPERISGHIEQVLRNNKDNSNSCSQHLAEIVESVSLVSNQELLKESISVEKEREKLELKNCLEEVDQITQIVDLVDLIHDYLIKNGYFGTMNDVSIPSYFLCPLSLEFMLDPVIVASGQTFQRSSIQKWLDQGLRICPKTRQHLSHTNLIPNYTVKALIANWFQENNLNPPNTSDNINGDDLSTQDVIHTDSFCCSVPSSESISGEISSGTYRGVDPTKSNYRSPVDSYAHSRTHSVTSAVSSCDYMPSSASELSRISDLGEKVDSGHDETTTSSHVEELVENLKNPSNEKQTEASAELRFLAKNNMENRIIIGKCGAIEPLISLLHSDVLLTQEHSVTTLLNLSLNEEIKSKIAEVGIIEPLIHVLKTGNDTAKENSAAALFSFSLLEDFKVKIGRSGAIKALVDLLAQGTIRGKKDALTALFNLSICDENKARIVQAGTAKYLVQLLDPSLGMVDKSVALLANLSTVSEGRLVIAKEGGIPLIVEIVESGSQRGKENAASVLLQMCLHSNKYCNLVLQEGAIPPLVALSQSGTSRAKEKAQQLLSHFRTQREGTSRKTKT